MLHKDDSFKYIFLEISIRICIQHEIQMFKTPWYTIFTCQNPHYWIGYVSPVVLAISRGYFIQPI